MGIMHFQLSDTLDPDALRELERASVAGGPDNMPTPTELTVAPRQLTTQRPNDESGYLAAPWNIPGHGRLMGTTATLMERARPYSLAVELARGKVNQMRSQAADWRTGGLQMTPVLQEAILAASRAFGRAVTSDNPGDDDQAAQDALTLGYDAARMLVSAYTEQVFHIRHQRSPKLDTVFGCRLAPQPGAAMAGPLAEYVGAAFNSVAIPFAWCDVEPQQGSYDWSAYEALLGLAGERGWPVTGGPLIDFSPRQLPAWLWGYEGDVTSLATFMGKYVEVVLRRYKSRIRRWQLTTASNCSSTLGLSEEELLGLTYRLADVVRQVDSTVEVVLGIAQPWGEYLTAGRHATSPFLFADNLIRSPLNNLAALDVELVMGVAPRGSYCRDVLEVSRLLDLYALLGLPLRVTLGYPASAQADADADPELRVAAGAWKGPFSPENQADWATTFVRLALCKPYVQAVHWVQLSDAGPHQFPHAGLADNAGRLRPAAARLRQLREQHLR